MDKTTREALMTLKTHLLVDSSDSFRIHAKAARAWRDAGYPDMDEPKPTTPETCWTCAHNYFDDDEGCYNCKPADERGSATERWAGDSAHIMRGRQAMPDKNHNGPPCPGWTPKEPA